MSGTLEKKTKRLVQVSVCNEPATFERNKDAFKNNKDAVGKTQLCWKNTVLLESAFACIRANTLLHSPAFTGDCILFETNGFAFPLHL